MMYFVIAAMKGEPGRPAGAGWAVCSGGGEEGAQGEGWARLPERTYCPGLDAGSRPGPSGPTQRRHLSPAAGSACLRLGAKAHGLKPPPESSLVPVTLWVCLASGGAPKRKFAGSLRAQAREARVWAAWKKPGRPQRIPRART